MTIALSVKINDGVVLATDSASTVTGATPQGPAAVFNIYNNANKAFNLLKGQPIGAVTWGAGGIGNASITMLVKDLRKRFKGTDDPKDPLAEWKLDTKAYTIEQVATKLRKFIYEDNYVKAFASIQDKDKPGLGFMVAGYSADAALADEYIIEIEQGTGKKANKRRLRFIDGSFREGAIHTGNSRHNFFRTYPVLPQDFSQVPN